MLSMDSNTNNRIVVDLKYNFGDTVWVANYFYDVFCPCKYSGKIEEIEIKITNRRQSIYYWVSINYEDGINFEIYPEATCFGSYDECVKWCDTYNARSAC